MMLGTTKNWIYSTILDFLVFNQTFAFQTKFSVFWSCWCIVDVTNLVDVYLFRLW